MTLRNTGTAAAVGTLSWAAQLSSASDATGATAVSITGPQLPSLAAGRTRAIPVSVELPDPLPTGRYTIAVGVSATASPADADPTTAAVISVTLVVP